MENRLKIVGHKLCPYVQRVVILAEEKNILYERIDIELHDKPKWLLEKSPTGKVPMLLIGEKDILFESSVICDYLDEASKGSLQPDDLFQKARLRS
jgi:glutathione S-transferase